ASATITLTGNVSDPVTFGPPTGTVPGASATLASSERSAILTVTARTNVRSLTAASRVAVIATDASGRTASVSIPVLIQRDVATFQSSTFAFPTFVPQVPTVHDTALTYGADRTRLRLNPCEPEASCPSLSPLHTVRTILTSQAAASMRR